eukprot:GSChrysophyteH1.ASY1.ANO1.1174.1 assembled CDS
MTGVSTIDKSSTKSVVSSQANGKRGTSKSSQHDTDDALAHDPVKLGMRLPQQVIDKTHNEESLGGGKHHVTMVVAGHVDAGKSTIVGNLLYQIGQVSQRTLHKYEKNSAVMGKASFALAWSMDETESERQHGVTIDIAEKTFETNSKVFSILDAPGHRDFIPNMISGAFIADVALLIIPASTGEYESCMGENAQTREHAILLKALGVVQIVVVVNKMDTQNWSRERFDKIQNEVEILLRELNFNVEKNVRFVPVSGLKGDNITLFDEKNTALKSWYQDDSSSQYTGLTLLQAIDSFRNPVRIYNKPLRAVISSISAEKDKGVTVRCNVLQGVLRSNRGVSLTACQGAATVKSIIDDDGNTYDHLPAGKTATVVLQDRSGRSGAEMGLREGLVICKGPPLVPLVSTFTATILTLPGLTPPVLAGSSYELYIHGQEVQCRIKALLSMKAPEVSYAKAVVIIEIVTADTTATGNASVGKVCVEPFRECRGLGRFALRAVGVTAAVGICDKVN